MAARVVPILLAVSSLLLAQRSAPRPKASDYSAHSALSSIEIGAEYLPQGMPGGKGAYSKDYLVVEAGVFPGAESGTTISKRQFTLRVDGNKTLPALSPGTAAVAEANTGSSSQGGSVVLGGPPMTSRFPSDRRDSQSKMPRSPVPLDSGQTSHADQGASAALPEGPLNKPVSGYLLFRFDGDAKSIRSLELDYDGGSTLKAKLRLL